MNALLSGLALLGTSIAAPFLVQLIKGGKVKAKAARVVAGCVSFVLAVIWAWYSKVATFPGFDSAGNVVAWVGSMLGYGAAVMAIATKVYDWFETNIFKKIPNLATVVSALIGGERKDSTLPPGVAGA